MSLTKIGSIGINTGIAFAGVTTIVTLNTANDALSIGATVNVGSGITLGASGDIFATGVSTVTTLKVGSGVTVSSDGDVFFTGIATGNGSGLTGINASNLGSGTVPTARLGSGTASSSTFLRGDSTFAAVTSTTINNNANNRLITGSGTANTLEGESTLTYDGAGNLNVTNASGAASVQVTTPTNTDGGIYFNDGSNSGAVTYLHTTDTMNFRVSGANKMIIDSSGRLLLGTTTEGSSSADDLTVATTGTTGITIRSGTGNAGNIEFSDGTSGTDEYRGIVQYHHSGDSMRFFTNAAERLRITSDGKIGIGDDTPSVTLETVGHNQVTFGSMPETIISYGTASAYNSGSAGGGINFGGYYNSTPEYTLFAGVHGVKENTTDGNYNGALLFSTRANGGNSSERARITSSGDIGVGVASPDGRFHIMGGNLGGAGSVTASTDADLLVLESNTSQGLSLLNANDERANIRFGTTGTDGNLEAGIQYAHESVSTTNDRRNMIFRSGGGEKMRIAGNGYTKMTNNGSYHDITDNTHEMYSSYTSQFVCRMRCSGNGYILYLDNNGATSAREFIEAYSRSDGEVKFRVNGSGNVYSRTNSYTGFSDIKLKENIVDASSQWDDIKSVKVRNFNFKKDDPSNKMIGVVAQEIETVSAGLVEDNIDRNPDTNEDLGTTTKGVKYSILYMKAIKCLQEAQTRIETLEAKVTALEG